MTAQPMPASLPRSVQSLGLRAVAEHPDGHRIVGIVQGCGDQGVILASPPLLAGFLADADGWTFTLADASFEKPSGDFK